MGKGRVYGTLHEAIRVKSQKSVGRLLRNQGVINKGSRVGDIHNLLVGFGLND